MRKPLIIANWKMNHLLDEALKFLQDFKRESVFSRLESKNAPEVAIAPSFVLLSELHKKLQFNSVKLVAQNVHWEERGAFTGEVSLSMLIDVGCDYVIIGHSERRTLFGETNALIQKKVAAALGKHIGVVLCVGESLEERESGKTFDIVGEQLTTALSCHSLETSCHSLEKGNPELPTKLAIAYEPVWAIGTGKTALPEQAEEVHLFLRKLLLKQYGEVADQIRIQYGGSVKPDNIASLMAQPNIDGALVGGASLEASSFAHIIEKAFL
ncbi:MAG: triose-phosphate isomerase [Deltaproteobacteria bacterium]|nr:triose-phosphate isomerase [Deltaproteobacteria bacterium]